MCLNYMCLNCSVNFSVATPLSILRSNYFLYCSDYFSYVPIFLLLCPYLTKWYFVTKTVLTYCEKKICSSDQEKLLKFEAERREFANFLRSLEQFIQTVKGQNNFQKAFLTCSWRFLRSNLLEQLEFELEKIIGI